MILFTIKSLKTLIRNIIREIVNINRDIRGMELMLLISRRWKVEIKMQKKAIDKKPETPMVQITLFLNISYRPSNKIFRYFLLGK